MIRYVPTSLFMSPAQTLVNTVNTVGVMGKGIALEFKNRYPDMFNRYRTFCERKQIDIGILYLYESPNKWVLNFPTKKHWRNPSKIEWIEEGLKKFVQTYQDRGITSIAFPQLGCGNGGLPWGEVRPVMERWLRPLTIPVYIHVRANLPGFVPEHEDPAEIREYTAPREDVDFSTFLQDLHSVGLQELERIEDADAEVAPTVELALTGSDQSVRFREAELGDLWYRLRQRGALRPDEFPVV